MLKHSSKFTAFFLTISLAIFQFAGLHAQNVNVPRTPSPAALVGQTVGISMVTVSYSRPSVKGREIWGSQVPYGYNVQAFGSHASAPWRAGANENTTITFTHPAKVEGQDVPAGTYGLFFVINKDDSGEVILSKDYKSWGSFFYDATQDLLKAKIQIRNISTVTEMLTYDFNNNTKTGTELVLSWEKKQFPVKIEFAVDDIVMTNAATELKGPVGFSWQGYSSAANYAAMNGVNLEQGLTWIDLAIAQHKSFTTLNSKALILKKLGKTAESDKVTTEALSLADENELNGYGYQLIALNKLDDAISVLAMNTQRHPKSANAWDSLGEAYYLKGDKKNAKTNFTKALTLNPTEGTKVNSEKYLALIGK